MLFCKSIKKYDSNQKLSEADIITMLECLIDNIFAMFGERVFHQTFSILIDTYSGFFLATCYFMK